MEQWKHRDPHALTVWEEKEEAGLLASEAEPLRQMRLVAQNPHTTNDELAAQIDAMRETWGNDIPKYDLLAQAIAAHPNASPLLLLDLLNHGSTHYTGMNQYPLRLSTPLLCRGLCQNPVAPFLVLETPDFWHRVEGEACEAMLADAYLPPFIVTQFMRHSSKYAVEAAQLHVTTVGEVQISDDGPRALLEADPTFGTVQAVQRAPDFRPVYQLGQSLGWKRRLTAALKLIVTNEPFTEDAWGRSSLDLLNHLARDGNRLVRWAAKTRLADSKFVFTWQE